MCGPNAKGVETYDGSYCNGCGESGFQRDLHWYALTMYDEFIQLVDRLRVLNENDLRPDDLEAYLHDAGPLSRALVEEIVTLVQNRSRRRGI